MNSGPFPLQSGHRLVLEISPGRRKARISSGRNDLDFADER